MDLMGVFDWHVVIFINTVYIYMWYSMGASAIL